MDAEPVRNKLPFPDETVGYRKQSFKMLQESSTHWEIIESGEGTPRSGSGSKKLLKYT